jgi:hypothetical protein
MVYKIDVHHKREDIKWHFKRSVFRLCLFYILLWIPIHVLFACIHSYRGLDVEFLTNLDSHVMVIVLMMFVFFLTSSFNEKITKLDNGITMFCDTMNANIMFYTSFYNMSDFSRSDDKSSNERTEYEGSMNKLRELCRLSPLIILQALKGDVDLRRLKHVEVESEVMRSIISEMPVKKTEGDEFYNKMSLIVINSVMQRIINRHSQKKWLDHVGNINKLLQLKMKCVNRLLDHKLLLKDYYRDEFVILGLFLITLAITASNIVAFGIIWSVPLTISELYLFLGTWLRSIQVREMYNDREMYTSNGLINFKRISMDTVKVIDFFDDKN